MIVGVFVFVGVGVFVFVGVIDGVLVGVGVGVFVFVGVGVGVFVFVGVSVGVVVFVGVGVRDTELVEHAFDKPLHMSQPPDVKGPELPKRPYCPAFIRVAPAGTDATDCFIIIQANPGEVYPNDGIVICTTSKALYEEKLELTYI